MSRAIESLCTKCGAPAEVGLIFCKKCGAVLGPTDPLIRPLSQTEIGPSRTGKVPDLMPELAHVERRIKKSERR
jgi:hypothetical protein